MNDGIARYGKYLTAGAAVATGTFFAREKIRTAAREWLLDEEERRVVVRLDDLEDELQKTSAEWQGIKRALDSADVWGEDDLELDEVDILVVAGRNHLIEGASFGGSVNVTSADGITISKCRVGQSTGADSDD